MENLYLASAFFLGSTVVICCIGLASPKFHDNLLQCIGMVFLIVGCGSRASDLMKTAPLIPWDWFCVHAGIGLFAFGVFWKIFLAERYVRFRAFAETIGHPWPDRRQHPHVVRIDNE